MKQILKQVLIFSIFILFISGANNSFVTLLNYIHNAHGESHQSHAQIFFILNSIISIFVNILIPNLKISNLKLLTYIVPITFAITYIFSYLGFVTQNDSVSFILLLIQSVLAAIGNSIMWIVTGKYIIQLCEIHSLKKQSGTYYGIFGGIMACNFLVGAIISALVFQFVNQQHDIYLFLAAINLVGIFYCKFFILDFRNQQKNLLNKEGNQTLNLQETQNKKSWISTDFKCNKICLFKNIATYKQMSSLMPFQILNGLMIGYVFHCSQDLVFAPSQQDKQKFLTINLIFLGLGGASGAFICGKLSDKMSLSRVSKLSILFCLLSFFMGILSLAAKLQIISLVTAFISGFALLFQTNNLVIMCAKVYQGTIDNFAINRQMINVSFMIYFFGINIISKQDMQEQMYYEIGLFIIVGLVCLYFVKFLRLKPLDATNFGSQSERKEQKNQTLELNQVQMEIDSSIHSQKPGPLEREL